MLKEKSASENNIFKSLIILAIPIVFSNIMQTLYQLIDTFWVGRLGSKAVAAITATYPILFLMLSLGGGFAIAGTILVTQFKGNNNIKEMNRVSSQLIFYVFIISSSIAVTGYYGSPFFIKIMGVEEEIYLSAVSYLRLSFIGGMFVFVFMVFQSVSQGVGVAKPPALIVFFTVILNMVLDPLLIFGYKFIPATGIKGAAIATIISQFIASSIGIAMLFKGSTGIKINFSNFKPDLALFKKILILGIPVSIEYSSRAVIMLLITAIAASFGTLSLAAYGVGIRIFSIVVIVCVGLSTATSALVGQNMGAGKTYRAEKTAKFSFLTAFSFFSAIGIIFFIFSKNIAKIFFPSDYAAIELTSCFIKILSLGFGFTAVQISLNGTFRGSGNTIISMSLTILSMWILRLPLAYFLSHYIFNSVTGVWVAFPVSNVITAIAGIILFLKGSWKTKKIIGD